MDGPSRNDAKQSRELLLLADQVIQQTHYEHLDTWPQCAIRPEIADIRPSDVVCLFRITELVCGREDGSLQGLTTVLNALHSCGATCMMLLQCREGRSELYLGAVNKQKSRNLYYLNTIRDILSTGLEGNLPGTELKEVVTRGEIEQKLQECLDDGFDTQCITSVSCVAAQVKSGESVSGIEKLLGAVGKKNFSLLVLADPVDTKRLQMIRRGYEELATELSQLESVTCSTQSSVNTSVSTSYSNSFTRTIGESISHTQSHTSTNGWSTGKSEAQMSGGEQLVKAAAYAMVGPAAHMLMGNSTQSEGITGSEAHGNSNTHGTNEQESRAQQEGGGSSMGKTEGVSIQTVRRERHIQELLSKVDSYLKWLNRCENYGMFDCCAYVISGNAGTNLLVASQYQALMQGEAEMNQPVTINTWTQANGVEQVRGALKHLMHPTVLREGTMFSPAMLISSKELARQMALPQEPVVGVSVMEYASFGREVVRKSPVKAGRVARIGVVTHMGKKDPNQPVLLDLQSLASHTFIAGTNGSGKSNTIFRLLEELLQAGIPFMVIEPAKGEYKNVFSREKSVRVYGTNRSKTPLFRLNPFWFNEDVNIKEHIARLMDVFNASWPMYAAMPSVLNAAIENAYKSCGWNLNASRCVGRRIFPTVQDVLDALGEKMETTAFSAEVKGNYVGALSTRLEALCSGIYADIFAGADLGDQALFESNVLIDLSRAGSSEISAMVMGILLIRLREYRMSEGALNHPLRHVTVLEEAHHLLRKTSTAQSEEGSNMMGKAVEMISNAIAEMRSYGDGFIIADQSPGLLDASVLRNTNTKIIMRLPEGGDRELVGNTIGLTQKQTYELSRLKTGVCAIYQKDWLEAVLCQVDRAAHEEQLYVPKPEPDEEDRRRRVLIELLLQPISGPDRTPMTAEERAELILSEALPGVTRRKLLQKLALPFLPWRQRAALIAEVVPLTMEAPVRLDEDSLREWMLEISLGNELDRWVTPEQVRLVIAAHAWKRAETENQWKDIAEVLYYRPEVETDHLEAVRGKAFGLLCAGKNGADSALAENDIRDLLRALSGSEWEADRQLSALLQRFQQTGRPRERGEIRPYSGIAWTYLGGEQSWKLWYSAIQNGAYGEWDRHARQELARSVRCGRRLQTELLSLALQYKGSDKAVRGFYYSWLAWAKRAETGSLKPYPEETGD